MPQLLGLCLGVLCLGRLGGFGASAAFGGRLRGALFVGFLRAAWGARRARLVAALLVGSSCGPPLCGFGLFDAGSS